MGIKQAPPQCYITGLESINIPSQIDEIDYYIIIDNKNLNLKFPSIAHDGFDQIISKNRAVFYGLILNHKWNAFEQNYLNKDQLAQILLTQNFPRTVLEKLDYLLLSIIDTQRYAGDLIRIDGNIPEKYFLENWQELNFYLKALIDQNYIKASLSSTIIDDIQLTFKGLERGVQLQYLGENSNNCFIAMSFDKSMNKIRDSIKLACVETGYKPILVDEAHPDSDQTINDKIVADIKKCKFLIADFTQQKDGVYFESGYAAGRGLKVIYTCQRKDFEKSHFDTNHFPHLIYDSPEELTEMLVNKIEAWIDN